MRKAHFQVGTVKDGEGDCTVTKVLKKKHLLHRQKSGSLGVFCAFRVARSTSDEGGC